METLQQQLDNLESQKAQLFEQETIDYNQVSYINEQIKAVQAQIEQEQQEQLVQKQVEYTGGLKEILFQVFDSVLPQELGVSKFGLSDYHELAQTFRQMVDVAVDENNASLYAVIGEQMNAKDTKISAMTAANIDLDTKLQEAIRKEQHAQDNYNRALAENERVEQENVRLANIAADKDVTIAELHNQIEAKDEQINKLEEELSKKPAAGIVLPTQKPSQSLADMMAAAKDKAVKSQLDLALTGNNYRGKVELTPIAKGGSESENSFRVEPPAIIPADDRVSAPEEEVSSFQPTEVQDNDNALEGFPADGKMESETVTREEFEEIRSKVIAIETYLNLH